jgi:hypothetical protein
VPCVLEDVSSQTKSDFDLNYGGIENENNPSKFAAYQLMVNKLPIGYRDLSPQELSNMIDEWIKNSMKSLENVKSVKFGYEEIPAYVGESSKNGYAQKGIIFHKENFIYSLTVISNDDLDGRFNTLTNNIKFLNSSENQGYIKQIDNSLKTNFEEKYENKYFSLEYPKSWQIEKENEKVTDYTTIALMIMEKRINSNEFVPNINIIVSDEKKKESTTELAQLTISQNKKLITGYKMIELNNNISIDGCKSSKITQLLSVNGFEYLSLQYIVKKKDNTTFIVSASIDKNKRKTQENQVNDIINTIKIK